MIEEIIHRFASSMRLYLAETSFAIIGVEVLMMRAPHLPGSNSRLPSALINIAFAQNLP
ncbi:MAG: hypothetical protein R3F19_31975 [Verrucomicrobiales bacterium]